MRADRLVAALLLLQARGRVTAGDLAQELEVSVATARRDLEALSVAGIPVYPQSGRGGGWSLLGGARTDLSGLTRPEAEALFLLLGPVSEVEPAARAALRKLVRALPATFRANAQAAASAVVVDPARWGEHRPERSDLVETLQTAVIRRRRVRLTYNGRTRAPTQRLIDPLGLIDKDGIWYLVAGTDTGRRTFRIDRVAAAVMTDVPFERPADFDLSEAWDQVVGEVERRRSLTSATLLVEARYVPVMRVQFGRHCAVIGPEGEDRVRVTVAAPTALDIARHLAGWGALVEVVDPAPVQVELARIGSELTARYQA